MRKLAILLLIFILAFSVRAIYIFGDRHLKIESDEEEYDRLAVNLAHGMGYINSDDGAPTSLRPPLYPAILAIVYLGLGHNIFIVKILQAIAGALTVCLLYLTAYKIMGKTAAVLTAIFSSFYMTFVVCSGLLYTETFFTFMLALIIFLVITTDKFSLSRFCLIGLLCGLLTLLRSNGFFVFLIAIAAILLKTKDDKFNMRKRAASYTGLVICFFAVIAPWTIRNYMVHGRVVPISTNGGMNIYQSLMKGQQKLYVIDQGGPVASEAKDIRNEADRSAFYFKLAVEFYRKYPITALKMLLTRFLFFLNVIDWEIMGGQIINYHFIFILPFAFFGIISAIRTKKDILPIMLVISYFFASLILFQGTPRYRMPIDGYIIMLGCYGIYNFISVKKKKTVPLLCTGVYFLVSYLLYRYSAVTKDFLKTLMMIIGLW